MGRSRDDHRDMSDMSRVGVEELFVLTDSRLLLSSDDEDDDSVSSHVSSTSFANVGSFSSLLFSRLTDCTSPARPLPVLLLPLLLLSPP